MWSYPERTGSNIKRPKLYDVSRIGIAVAEFNGRHDTKATPDPTKVSWRPGITSASHCVPLRARPTEPPCPGSAAGRTSVEQRPRVLHLQLPRARRLLAPEVHRHERPVLELPLQVVVLPFLQQTNTAVSLILGPVVVLRRTAQRQARPTLLGVRTPTYPITSTKMQSP